MLEPRYRVSKADGSEADPDGMYFVLKLNSKDERHACASRKAALAYADGIEDSIPGLARDLRAVVRQLDHNGTSLMWEGRIGAKESP